MYDNWGIKCSAALNVRELIRYLLRQNWGKKVCYMIADLQNLQKEGLQRA